MSYAIQAMTVNGTILRGVRGYSIEQGEDIMTDAHDGTVHELGHHVMRTAPQVESQHRDLEGLVGVLASGVEALPTCRLDGTDGLLLQYAAASDEGPGYADSGHSARRVPKGIGYLTGVEWSEGQAAEASMRWWPVSTDGIASPFAAPTVSLPAASGSLFGWVLESISRSGGSALTDVASVSLTVDPQAEYEYDSGKPHPVDVRGAGVQGPTEIRLEIETRDLSWGAGSGAIAVVFRRMAQGGGFATGADTRLTITLVGGWSREESRQAQQGERATDRIMVLPRFDGTNMPLTWVLGSSA